jgi:hypothetical protein
MRILCYGYKSLTMSEKKSGLPFLRCAHFLNMFEGLDRKIAKALE